MRIKVEAAHATYELRDLTHWWAWATLHVEMTAGRRHHGDAGRMLRQHLIPEPRTPVNRAHRGIPVINASAPPDAVSSGGMIDGSRAASHTDSTLPAFQAEVRGSTLHHAGVVDGDRLWVDPGRPAHIGDLVLARVSNAHGARLRFGHLIRRSNHVLLEFGTPASGEDQRSTTSFKVIGPVISVLGSIDSSRRGKACGDFGFSLRKSARLR
jgi:SOS-response transcriptional repressor LexA